MNNLIFVYITNSSKEEARKIARYLLNKKLIACVNIFPGVESIYPWKGKIVNAKEVVLIAKTLAKNFEKIKTEVKKIHSYEIPCIVKLKINANKDFEKWINSCLLD